MNPFNLAAAALLVGGGAMLTHGAIPRFVAINAAPAPAPVAAIAVSDYHNQPIWAQMMANEYCDNIEQLQMTESQALDKAFQAVAPLYGTDMQEVPDTVAMASIEKAAASHCGRKITWA
jgi:hypothetical protein